MIDRLFRLAGCKYAASLKDKLMRRFLFDAGNSPLFLSLSLFIYMYVCVYIFLYPFAFDEEIERSIRSSET